MYKGDDNDDNVQHDDNDDNVQHDDGGDECSEIHRTFLRAGHTSRKWTGVWRI